MSVCLTDFLKRFLFLSNIVDMTDETWIVEMRSAPMNMQRKNFPRGDNNDAKEKTLILPPLIDNSSQDQRAMSVRTCGPVQPGSTRGQGF